MALKQNKTYPIFKYRFMRNLHCQDSIEKNHKKKKIKVPINTPRNCWIPTFCFPGICHLQVHLLKGTISRSKFIPFIGKISILILF